MLITKRHIIFALSALALFAFASTFAAAQYVGYPGASSAQVIQPVGVAPMEQNVVATDNVQAEQPAIVQDVMPAAAPVSGYGVAPVASPYTAVPTTGYAAAPITTGVDPAFGCAPLAAPAVAPLAAPVVAPIATPLVSSGGFTRTYEASSVGGTFVPPQTNVVESFYSHPGVTPYGAYPGAGAVANYGVGFTPYGYSPYGALAYL
ncbi:hypothetical protein CUJ83_06780 [Methanocella sp. CWC-04]|uniref:Uncharacterized protein n=1 Tax=Methanooceanicella nereidis TaxID=2052831 RepID=A0AAP2W5V6_9EURY|nr:hypothetical protein [Methanocella sp. CWC-04]MCD1294703.1 hypothetical protein [Methanocella sp. CWC-04]